MSVLVALVGFFFSICLQVDVHKFGACKAFKIEALGWRVEWNIRLQEFVKLEFRMLFWISGNNR